MNDKPNITPLFVDIATQWAAENPDDEDAKMILKHLAGQPEVELHEVLEQDAWYKGYNDYEGDGYNNPYPGDTDQWKAYQGGWEENQRQYTERWAAMREPDEEIQPVDPMLLHKCRTIAAVRNLGPGREWWMGELTEPIPGHEGETHCLHIKTPYKSVVWGINLGDMLAYAVLAHILHGKPINPHWLDIQADLYRKQAEKTAGQSVDEKGERV